MQQSQKTLTIIGMGLAGLGCAWNISKNKLNINLILLEKSQKVGGRATSNSRHGYIYDHGANYFTFDGLINQQRLLELIKDQLPKNDLVEIKKNLYLFNEKSEIYPSKEVQKSEKWTYKKGIIQLSQLIRDDQNLNIQFEQHVETLEYNQQSKKWTISYIDKKNNNENKQVVSDFVLLTPPAPQIADIFKKSNYYRSKEIVDIFSKCLYIKQICLVVAFDKKIQNLPYFALLNEDRQHDIAWISVEDDKEGHIQQDKSLLVCQMSEDFTEKNYNENDEVVQQKCKESLLKLIPQLSEQSMFDNIKFIWVKRWRYALPKNNKIEQETLNEYQNDGLYFAGDYLIGKGRVLVALEKGLIASDMIQSKL